MVSSDDEGDTLPEIVSDYNFLDENDAPISFAVLPVKWSDNSVGQGKKSRIYICGTVDSGLEKIYQPVTAWKFDLSRVEPIIWVLRKGDEWLKLGKWRKSFEHIVRSILITVSCLHIVKKNHEASGKPLWDQLSRIFSAFEQRPSENDLIEHILLIKESLERDKTLAKSQFLTAFLEKRPQMKKLINEDSVKSQFIVDEEYMSDEGEDFEDESHAVCAICDDGGNLIGCDGVCMRSFHAVPEDAADAHCETLGLSKREMDATLTWYCKNCLHKQHQCISCGKLGSSDKVLGTAEVFQCASAKCGFFYHPVCVANLVHPDNEADAEVLRKIVTSGEPFTCPSHRCHVCKQMENAEIPDLQFAVCRRCPRSYHRKCLPRRISSEETEQRAWEGLLPDKRILIYCLKHKIDPELGTPKRTHIKFPDEEDDKKKVSETRLLNKAEVLPRTISPVPRAEECEDKPAAVKLRKVQVPDAPSTFLRRKQVAKGPVRSSAVEEGKSSLGEQLYAQFVKQSNSTKPSKFARENQPRKTVKTDLGQSNSSLYELGADSVNRIDDLMKEAESSIPSNTNAHSQKAFLDMITLGKVEGFRQAIEVASRKLDECGNIQDAQAVCGPNVLKQMIRWKQKLKLYITPFLHGMRYTSFGRHFTKADKLKEIVDMMHWYVQDGDTVVDFCCGSNDFSCLMKEKLEQTGKKCFFRNFDLFRPKNDFAFEKRDFMSVNPSELPEGSKLIMGLNPPFGVNASLANKFVNQALKFKPKLIVLIVPRETQRLDEKNPAYDLVWEDREKLSGMSFYLPGSVDINDKQLDDWNVVSPPLYLWSRSDFTSKHRAIAEKYGHHSDWKKPMLESRSTQPVSHHSSRDKANVVDMEIDDVVLEDHKEKPGQDSSITKGEVQPSSVNTKNRIRNRRKKLLKQREAKEEKRRQVEEEFRGKVSSDISNGDKKESGTGPLPEFGGEPDLCFSSPTPYRHPSPLNCYSPVHQEHLSAILGDSIGYSHGHQRQSGFSDLGVQYGSGYIAPLRPAFVDSIIPRRFGLENEGTYLSGQHGRQSAPQQPFDDPEPTYRTETESYNYLRAYNGGAIESGGFHGLNLPPTGSSSSFAGGGSSRTTMTAMQRYAPRLDELNHARQMGSARPNLSVPGVGGSSSGGIYNYQSASGLAYQGAPMGFAPGSRYLYPPQGARPHQG